MSEPVPPAAPAAPGLPELLERSLTGLLLGRAAYAPLAERPAPAYRVMTGLALFYAASAIGLNVALNAIERSSLLGRSPVWFFAGMIVIAIALCVPLLFAFASLLWGLARLLRGQGEFARAFQAAAMLFALTLVRALADPFPFTWPLSSLLFVWAGAGALAGLLRASFPAALLACALLASLSLGAQTFLERAFAPGGRYSPAIETVELASALASLESETASMESELARTRAAMGLQGAQRPGASGLDLLRGPGEDAAPAAPGAKPEQALLQQGDALRASAEGMLQTVAPLLTSPALTRNLDAQGKADLRELQDLIAKMQEQARATSVDAREQAETMRRLQELSLRLMSRAMGSAGAVSAPAERKGR